MIRRLTFAALDGRAHNIGLFGGVVCNVRPMARKWPVVRRETEYSTIRSVLDGQSQVGGIVVIGDAGVGKTTLARLVTRSLSCPVHWVAGTESARSIPLGVFAQFVGSATAPDPVAFWRLLAKPFSRRSSVSSGSMMPICWTSCPPR